MTATSLQRASTSGATQPAVEIQGLVKTFGHTLALDGLDLTVAPGDITGFLGPNGAGKSTTIRVLLGLLRANSGTVRLLGGDPWRDAVDLHRRIAYVPGDVTLWPNLTGLQAIDFLARLRGKDAVDTRRRDQLIERFELDPHKKARTYSKGNRQKVAIVAAFSTNAELYILDEPTSGLDPLMEKAFQTCVTEVADHDGHYVFSVDRNELDGAMALLTELGIIDLTVTPASLEDMFLREYRGADR
jgi:ABC-2 type transport system ATP-binding protein